MERSGNNRIYIKYILIIALGILTIYRIYLGMNIPLYIQGDARYDDFLMVKYADSIASGQWLGVYDHLTLVKTAAMPILLACGYHIGISYSASLTVLYMISVMLIALALGKLLNNKAMSIVIYSYLLFSPIMFHKENVQKIYRGGYIVIFALLVVACVIGLFAYSYGSIPHMLAWSIVGIISLPIFWYLKEDSIWILPFVILGTIITSINIIAGKDIKKKGTRIVICLLPLMALFVSIVTYRSINEKHYGLYIDTDRNNTYFAKVINDLLKIENATEGSSWLTREALLSAINHSSELASIEDNILLVYDSRAEGNGNVDGDFFIWGLREAADNAGIYNNGAENAEAYWRNVHNQLEGCYTSGALKETPNIFFVSSVTRGATISEMISYLLDNIKETTKQLVCYEYNDIELISSKGDSGHVALMAKYAGTNYIDKDTPYDRELAYNKTIKEVNQIVRFYKISALWIFRIALVGFLAYFINIFSYFL